MKSARTDVTLRWFLGALVLLPVAQARAEDLQVKAAANTAKLMPYQVFEITFQHPGKYGNPNWDVTIDLALTSPSGKKVAVGGFFYGSSKPQKPVLDASGDPNRTQWPCDPADLWKARYAPSELGDWKYAWTFRNAKGASARGQGAFQVVAGRAHQKGWIRINPRNPFRFIYEDGSPYYPLGFQDGVGDGNANGSALDAFAMEGPFRLDRADERPKLPPGAMFVRGPSMNPQNGDVMFGRKARAGFNMWRFSPDNCSPLVFARDDDARAATLDNVRWEQAVMVDEMLQMTRKYGLRNFYGFFGYHQVFGEPGKPLEPDKMAKVKRIIKYSVDRWGAYVDIWEFLNEQKVSDEWYAEVIPYLKSVDPYGKPVSTSWQRPDIAGIDINSPHWYENEDELTSDLHVAEAAARRKKEFAKPLLYGEQGNNRGDKDLTAQGIGGVWDPGSARRMRVRTWAALFNEVHYIFWETSYAKDGHYMNLWIGPEERQYVHALQDFAGRLDRGVKPAAAGLDGPQAAETRAYALRSDKTAALYLHHFACAQCGARPKGTEASAQHNWSHNRGQVRDLKVTLDVPAAATGYWYDPRSAAILARFNAPKGPGKFTAPPFEVDLALLVTPAEAPDIDHDGKPNDLDDDDDNDGVPDAKDAWPLEREESSDADGDRIGDNLDADVDADGKADDLNRNGVPDNEEKDSDGDGYPNADAVPWDAFPRDPKEWRDTDGDGIGDNADPDDDGDGYSDDEERAAGTDPLNPLSFP